MIIVQEKTPEKDRTEAFKQLAIDRAEGRIVPLPTTLPPEERRLYVRQTLREDHQFRIENRPEGAQSKFDKLADSPFKFFRGTALLYYRDHVGMDLHLPAVFTIGDVHPENFGVMPNEDGAPFFGVNDFDEATFAPFSYDVKRGAVGFYIIAKENGLKKKKKRRQVVRRFVEGYLQGLQEFAKDDREKWHEYRLDNSPSMIRELLESAQQRREEFLEEMIDLEKERFVSGDEIVPHSKHIERFQEIVDKYREDNDLPEKEDGFYKVIDVAVKKDSGTASLGLDRYFVVLNGRSEAVDDNIILELKQARRTALHGLIPDFGDDGQAAAEVTAEAHHVHLAGGDPFYGHATIDEHSFLVRERSPYKDDIDVDDLDYEELQEYAHICGEVLAQTHARSDEDTGIMEGDAEERILSSIHPQLFTHDVIRFAEASAKRIYKDYKQFKKDHAIGAFDFVNA